jgi:hypothetical protein
MKVKDSRQEINMRKSTKSLEASTRRSLGSVSDVMAPIMDQMSVSIETRFAISATRRVTLDELASRLRKILITISPRQARRSTRKVKLIR